MTVVKGIMFRGIFYIVVGLLSYSPSAVAGDKLFLTGAEGGNGIDSFNYYAFAAVIAPLPKNNLGDGFVQKYWVDFIGYDYVADNETIKATAPAIEGALGYQMSGANWWNSVYAGIRYSNTRLSPDDLESVIRGSQTRVRLQVEGERTFASRWKINALGSYILISDAYYIRLRGLYRLYNEVVTGPEAIVLGDPDYRIWQWGWVVTGFEPSPRWTAGMKVGIKKIEKGQTGSYIGFEFTRLF